MLSASSPIAFPKSSPTAPKRSKPHDHQDGGHAPKPRPRVAGPFVDDGDSSDSDLDELQESSPATKKRMLQRPGEIGTLDVSLDASNIGHDSPPTVQNEDESAEPSRSDLPSTQSMWEDDRPLFSGSFLSTLAPKAYTVKGCSGNAVSIKERSAKSAVSYGSMVAARSKTKEGRAQRSYYGIDVHELMNTASKELADKQQTQCTTPDAPVESVESHTETGKKPKKSLLWTEKYRARKFMDLCGDDGTNRQVLRWLKRWDPVVFPGASKSRPSIARRPGMNQQTDDEKPHRKILMLTGPPGLGKTTLAHVCAKQAGYEVIEINASDDRSRDVVKNRIRTSLGTESVKNVSNRKDDGTSTQKVAKPACVVVDEVDGVVSGSGGSGEGGFVKALIDLVLVDQKNASAGSNDSAGGRKRKGDDFRLLRPLILICNDVYHPSLRPLRQSNLAEIVHVGRPQMDAVVGRLKAVFEKEGIPCDKDAARKLCEAAWGMTSGIDAKRGAESTVEGDLRGVMVVGEWVAARFRASSGSASQRLTRQWIEQNITHDLASGAAGARGLGRGSVKDIVSRLFQEGGGFPKQAMNLAESNTKHEQPKTELGFGEQQKKYSMGRLEHMISTSGEISYIMTEIFAEYPNRDFNDDSYLTKPDQAYDWMHFHDTCQSRLFASQDWELAPYLSQPALACHHLFASARRHIPVTAGFDKRWGAEADDEPPPVPFSGPRADFQAHEAERHSRAQLQVIQAQLSPTMTRSFRSPEDMAVDFLPYLARILNPDVKPVVVGGSQGVAASVRREGERAMVRRAADALADVGVALVKGKIESDEPGRGPHYVYRMEPDLDALCTFGTGVTLLSSQAPARFAVRQVLDQELQRAHAQRESIARQARFAAGSTGANPSSAMPMPIFDNKENLKSIIQSAKTGMAVKKDFFGRVIEAKPLSELDRNVAEKRARREERKVWVTFHEGLNNAVRKPISLQEFLGGL